MKWRWIPLALALTAGVAWAQPHKRPATDAGRIRVPQGAQPIATTTLDEIRAFPEMAGTSAGREFTKAEKAVDVEGLDTVYQTDKSYDETVAFFDQQLKQPGFQLMARTVTMTATAWTARRPDKTLVNVVVRSTTPQTTFEVAEAQSRGTLPQIR